MNSSRKLISILTGLIMTIALVGLFASPANADHSHAEISEYNNEADSSPATVTVEHPDGSCGETTFSSSWDGTADELARLVISIDGEDPAVVPIGETHTVGPFDSPATIQWRLFAGGERDYDIPLWGGHPFTDDELSNDEFRAEINAYGDEHGFDWTVGAPDGDNEFLTWNRIECTDAPLETSVGGCDNTTILADWEGHENASLVVDGYDDTPKGESLTVESSEEDQQIQYQVVGSGGKTHFAGTIEIDACPPDPAPTATPSESPEAMLPVTGPSSRWLLNAGIVLLVLSLVGVGAAVYYQRRRGSVSNS